MTPQDAIQILSNAAQMAKLTYLEHEACKQSVSCIINLIQEVETRKEENSTDDDCLPGSEFTEQ